MLTNRGDVVTVWPSPILQVLAGGGISCFGAFYLVDVLTADDLSAIARPAFTLLFAFVTFTGVRLLTARVRFTSTELVAHGMWRATRIRLAEIQGVDADAVGYGGPRVAVRTDDGQHHLLPMICSSASRQRQLLAEQVDIRIQQLDE